MTRRSPGHPPWNVPAELNNEEVTTDSCDSSFSGNVRADTESQGRNSGWRQARGAAGGSGCSPRLQEGCLAGQGKLQLGFCHCLSIVGSGDVLKG